MYGEIFGGHILLAIDYSWFEVPFILMILVFKGLRFHDDAHNYTVRRFKVEKFHR